MKLFNINKFYINTQTQRQSRVEKSSNPFLFNGDIPKIKTLTSDTISFKARNYELASIKEQTNHCAYCGAKVYTEKEIEVLATEIMQSTKHTLQGKIRSIIEKLGGKSDNALIQKKMEVNSDNISFFNKLKELAAENPTKSGAELLAEHFHLEKSEIPKVLIAKIKPLLKTVDHVVPQKQDIDNDNDEMNLVESCFTCNSKIKNGSSFRSFFYMYPTIKATMPKEKFEFASLGILENSPDVIISKMDTQELVKVFDNLFEQRNNIRTSLYAIEEKIKNCTQGIVETIAKIKGERETKEIEKRELQDTAKSYAEDEEFQILQKRKELTNKITDLKTRISDLTTSITRYNRNIQTWETNLKELDSSKTQNRKKGKKQVSQNTENREELQSKIIETKKTVEQNLSAKKVLERELQNAETELQELNTNHPEIETLKAEKSKLEGLIQAHSQISVIKQKLNETKTLISSLEQQIKEKEKEQSNCRNDLIDEANISEEDRTNFKEYLEIVSALKELEDKIEAKDKFAKIYASFAKKDMEARKEELSHNPLVQNYNISKEIEIISSQIETLNVALKNAKKQVGSLETQLVMFIDKIQEYSSLEQDEKITSFSLKETTDKIAALTSNKAKLEQELEQIPEDKEITNIPQDEALLEEYNKLISAINTLKQELLKQMPKNIREKKKTELAELEVQVDVLCEKDRNIFSGNNLRKLEILEINLEQLQKGLANITSGKSRDQHIKQINELKEEIKDLADNDPTIFNLINAKRRNEILAKIEKISSQLKTLEVQKNAIEQRLGLTGNISDGFSQSQAEAKIASLEEKITRLTEKMHWLELPDKIRKIDVEIKIQNENILSLEQKLNSIQE